MADTRQRNQSETRGLATQRAGEQNHARPRSKPSRRSSRAEAQRRKLAVVAIGGNSLAKDPQHESLEDQQAAVRATCQPIATLISQGWTVVISHGNGPQVGYVLRRSEIAHDVEGLHEVPLDICGADTQGATGYMLQQCLRNELHALGIEKEVATVVTQTEVDAHDPAFSSPAKPVGSFMDKERAEARARELGWHVVEDAGRGWRRVVPSPRPQRIVEEAVISALLDGGICVIAAGGGGIPVVADDGGRLRGIAAVIDKDRASALLASALGASTFVVSTAVDRVALDFGTPHERWLDHLTLADARTYLAEQRHFGKGSMAPKIEACTWFLEHGGERALITTPENLIEGIAGQTGTTLTRK